MAVALTTVSIAASISGPSPSPRSHRRPERWWCGGQMKVKLPTSLLLDNNNNITTIPIPHSPHPPITTTFSCSSSSSFLNNSNKIPHRRPFSSRTSYYGGMSSSSSVAAARDRVIDFGKYKGRMLGTLPSTYLKWVSNNLRAGDSLQWALLADEVLTDPIYRDRIEWEMAEKLLNGDEFNRTGTTVSSSSSSSGVSELLDISHRFGWDNDDKLGWSKIDFGLLGTSKAARIPRLSSSSMMIRRTMADDDVVVVNVGGNMKMKMKKGDEDKKNELVEEEIISSEEEDNKRRERRERVRQRRRRSTTTTTSFVEEMESSADRTTTSMRNGGRGGGGGLGIMQQRRLKIMDEEQIKRRRMSRGSIHENYKQVINNTNIVKEGNNVVVVNEKEGDGTGAIVQNNPFPGREALLNKVLLNPRHRPLL